MSRVALSVLLVVFISSQAVAYDITSAGGNTLAAPVETITTQATEDIAGDTLTINRQVDGSTPFAVNDTLEISISGGATFADSVYTMEADLGGAGTGDSTYAVLQTGAPSGSSSITFRLQESISPTTLASLNGLILSGSNINGQAINFNLPQIDGRDIYITFTLRDSVGALKGTTSHFLFDNTLPRSIATEAETKNAIKNVLAAHIRNMTAQGAGLSGLLTGNGFGNSDLSSLLGDQQSAGKAFAAAAGFSLPVSMEMMGGQGSFAASLNQIRAWDGKFGVSDQKSGGKPSNRLAKSDSPFNVWIKGRWQGVTDTRGGTDGEGDFGLFMAGADYRYSQNTLVGVLAQFDFYNQTATGQSTKGRGRGWMFGPYLVTRLHDHLIWDARAAWGRSKNKIDPMEYGWDDFDGERWQVETNLTGDFEYQGWEIFPQLGMNYFAEEQKAYTSAEGTEVGSQVVEVGNLSFGPEVSRSWDGSDGAALRPFVALKGIWDFKSPDITHSDGSAIGTEKIRARAELGGDITFEDGGAVRAKYTFDGIGIRGYEAHSLELVASTPVDFGFLPNGSNLKSEFSQAASDVYASRFKFTLDVPLN